MTFHNTSKKSVANECHNYIFWTSNSYNGYQSQNRTLTYDMNKKTISQMIRRSDLS